MRPPSGSEAAFREAVQKNLRRNYLVQLAHGFFGQTGLRLIHAPTFIPVYIYALSFDKGRQGRAAGGEKSEHEVFFCISD